MSLIQSIVTQDEDHERASSLGSSDLQNEANDEGRPESPTINGEDELGGEENSEERPLIRHRPRPTTRDGTTSGQQVETTEDFSTSLNRSEAQRMQSLVKKLRLQVGPASALPCQRVNVIRTTGLSRSRVGLPHRIACVSPCVSALWPPLIIWFL